MMISATPQHMLFDAVVDNDLKLAQDLVARTTADACVDNSYLLFLAVKHASVEMAQWLVDQGCAPKVGLSCAVEEGSVEMAQLMLKNGARNWWDDGQDFDNAFGWCHWKMAQLLWDNAPDDVGAKNNPQPYGWFCNALQHDQTELARAIFAKADIDPTTDCGFPLRLSARANDTELVRMCLGKGANAASNCSEVLRWACYWHNEEMFDLVYPLSDPHQALKAMQENGCADTQLMWLVQRITADQECKVLHRVLNADQQTPRLSPPKRM